MGLPFLKGRGLLFLYLISEMLTTWLFTVLILWAIFVVTQVLNLTNIFLQHKASLHTFLELLLYVSLSLLPFMAPISLMLAASLTYSRLTNDSEVIAIKSLGLSSASLLGPGLFLALVISATSIYGSFYWAPWGNGRLENLVTNMAHSKIISTIREGTFLEDFFDLIVYTTRVERNKNELKKVFIFDERDKNNPVAIVAQRGQVTHEKNSQSYKALLSLKDGSIHKTRPQKHTKINFQKYDLRMSSDLYQKGRDQSLRSLNYSQLARGAEQAQDPMQKRNYKAEIHKRISHCLSAFLFILLSFGLTCRNHNRIQRSKNQVISVGVAIGYWGLFLLGSWFISQKSFPFWLGAWLPCMVFLPLSAFILFQNRQHWI